MPVIRVAGVPSPRLDERITLKDGRILCYAEFGDPNGEPVIAFHGFPGCRLEPWPHHRTFVGHSVRLISPDRPGSGNSTFQPDRVVIDYPKDVVELADHLGTEQFGILGISGGAPYAVSCANYLPTERISVVGLLAPAPPWEIDGQGPPSDGLRMISRLGDWAVRYVPWLVSGVLSIVIPLINWGVKHEWIIKKIDKKLKEESTEKRKEEGQRVKDSGQDEDADADLPLAIPEQRHQTLSILYETLKQGPKPIVQEAQLLLQPWGFDLADVGCPITIWHGTNDVNVPISQVRGMATKLPGAVMKEYESDHPGMLGEIGMVLDEMVSMIRSRSRSRSRSTSTV